MNQSRQPPRKRRNRNIGLWTIVGMSIGLLIGFTTENVAVGLAAGVSLSVLFASGLMSRP
jgi:hypothetical protein